MPTPNHASLRRMELLARAQAILDANRRGGFTVPSEKRYPHQWSWDSAFSAIGYARYDQARAAQELRSLFAAQWAGRRPRAAHCLPSYRGPPYYFPGPDFWQSERNPCAPAPLRTSGIVQPPIHATAVWHLYRYAADRGRVTAFVAEIFPRLEAWHNYLYRERDPRGEHLVYTAHGHKLRFWRSGHNVV